MLKIVKTNFKQDKFSDIQGAEPLKIPLKFGTKAETLENLRPILRESKVLDLLYFTVFDFVKEPEFYINTITQKFHQKTLVIRSSAKTEDSVENSMAGAFCSCLNVDGGDTQKLRDAIQNVIKSLTGDPSDQILVQPMVEDISMSGVVMTRDLDTGAPYYVINYDDETGNTDSVTGGTRINKTLFVFRGCELNKINSPRIRQVIKMTKEIEKLCPNIPLDIEFALNVYGHAYVFQVRYITLSSKWNRDIENTVSQKLNQISQFLRERSQPRVGVLGQSCIFGEMSDWNPAEIIGTNPRPLAASLYREIVTQHVWRDAREIMGYRSIPDEELMVSLGGRPFIDVRNSFNSFLPASLENSIAEKVIDAWLVRLAENPHLHDKIEFEVAQTCFDFSFDETYRKLYSGILSDVEYDSFKQAVRDSTNKIVSLANEASLPRALSNIEKLSLKQKTCRVNWEEISENYEILSTISNLLNDCKQLGTLSFSVIARHAFIAESLLRSAVSKKAITENRFKEFKASVLTISGQMSLDLEKVENGELSRNEFISTYGHLRPGTYDIMSIRYADRDDLFNFSYLPKKKIEKGSFELSSKENNRLGNLIRETELEYLTPSTLIEYAYKAIVGREFSKFVFSRNVSDALEGLAFWGKRVGLKRDDVSYLEFHQITRLLIKPSRDDLKKFLIDKVNAGRNMVEISQAMHLSYLVRSPEDLFVVPLHRSAPNFVGNSRLEGLVTTISNNSAGDLKLKDRIVCIENADPGYDWIFTRGIAGLITKYGGTNSHMAIRCAEFGLPAAIGCGPQLYDRLVKAGMVELNCGNKLVLPIYSN